MATDAPETPWHAAFPAPTSSLANGALVALSVDELRDQLSSAPASTTSTEDTSVLIVDVRRTDFEVSAHPLSR